MADRLFAVRDKIKRADEQLQVVKSLVREYFDSDVSSYSGEFDPSTNQHTIHQHVVFPDVRLSTLVGELVHDLRSALDHLAWQLVEEHGGPPVEGPGGTNFPILKEPPTDKKTGLARPLVVAGGVSPTALALIERAQPYWGGIYPEHQPLWVLHRMSIIDKHQRIPIHGVLFDNLFFGSDGPLPAFTWTAQLANVDEYHAEVDVEPDDPSVSVTGSATIYVLVHEPPGHPSALVQTVEAAADHVLRIVDEAAATCFAS